MGQYKNDEERGKKYISVTEGDTNVFKKKKVQEG